MTKSGETSVLPDLVLGVNDGIRTHDFQNHNLTL